MSNNNKDINKRRTITLDSSPEEHLPVDPN